ncbi:Fur family transcriptional regulator [Brachybacterium vulturis]|uniref:Fur family transcriptional regulator n=1 Tax=Brachybacterium vulturis TaxID=2017484 RepID=UPI003736D475
MQRNTRQRTAILETLARQDDFRSAQQIHEQMKADGETVGLATVYRNLQVLSRTDRLDVLVAGDGEALYRQCEDTGHHHHLVCRECGRTVEFLAPKLESAMTAIAHEHGFTDVDHTLEVFGLCSDHAGGDGPAEESADEHAETDPADEDAEPEDDKDGARTR